MVAALLILALVALGLAAALVASRHGARQLRREQFVRGHVFEAALLRKLAERHPQLTEKDEFLVARALRQFFIVRVRAGSGALLGMPSRVVDDLWHAFILDTVAYADFCQQAFGGFFHHVPASSTPKGQDIAAALHRTWRLACLEENINPQRATRLPLLFAIDQKLNIPGGKHYTLRGPAAPASQGGGSACGGVACSGGGDSGDGGGDGGGCSGGGCGGD